MGKTVVEERYLEVKMKSGGVCDDLKSLFTLAFPIVDSETSFKGCDLEFV